MPAKQLRRDLLPGTLDMLILKTLRREAMHGYGIAQHIRRQSNDVLKVGEGSLYPALQRLRVKSWVSAEWKTSASNRRARFYELTPLGREQLRRTSAEYNQLIQAIAAIMQPI